MAAYEHGVVLVKPEDVATGGVTSEMARKWKVLQDLQVRLNLSLKQQQDSNHGYCCMCRTCRCSGPKQDSSSIHLNCSCLDQ
jgi:hypothetical protein